MRAAPVNQEAERQSGPAASPFGSPGSPRIASLADAFRRCRWISVDLRAAGFAVYFVGAGGRLTPCFDHRYPGVADETATGGGEAGSDLARHARASTQPCWWNDGPDCAASLVFERLDWCLRAEPLLPGTAGIAFPVQSERGQSGLVVFQGSDIALAPEDLFDVHGRCFSLFDALSRIRPGESADFPSISRRELECLRLTANGCTSEDIARALKLSVHTANQYLTNTAQKLDAVNRVHAVAKALRMGLIE